MPNLGKYFDRWNKKFAQQDVSGCQKLRIWHRRPQKKKSPSMLIKCGDCDNKFEIYYSPEDLEIGGVLASKAEWRRVLGPLLK